MLVLNEKTESTKYILTVLAVSNRFKQLGRCSKCKKYNKRCKKLMNEGKP